MFEIDPHTREKRDPKVFLSPSRDKFSEIDAEIKSITTRISRLKENGDLKRLKQLRSRLTSLQATIEDIKLAEIERKKPHFRHSYAFYEYTEYLNTLN